MIQAVNEILECVAIGLFTAAFLVIACRLGWFPVIIVETISMEEAQRRAGEDEDDEQS